MRGSWAPITQPGALEQIQCSFKSRCLPASLSAPALANGLVSFESYKGKATSDPPLSDEAPSEATLRKRRDISVIAHTQPPRTHETQPNRKVSCASSILANRTRAATR
ncbi:Hypothetical predicted protein [Podarcis lilfordi]|uniref:Uncharacterized protein n=1 Tax=Podarcis lilfordi TaxID=74358 RepID=A0AA35L5F3_9SAUR|nr:Hypothetical predicted protein [Podarcis lilfordi]